MSNIDKALQTQLDNIQQKTGRSLTELFTFLRDTGLSKHGELLNRAKSDLSLGHGDANTLVHVYRQTDGDTSRLGEEQPVEDALETIYAGPKAHLRPVHEKLMLRLKEFGPFEVVPKKNYVSLRRKKQFAMIGPATNTRVEVGLNMKGAASTPRLQEMPAGGMCQYKVNVTDPAQVDDELVGWVRQAYDGAG